MPRFQKIGNVGNLLPQSGKKKKQCLYAVIYIEQKGNAYHMLFLLGEKIAPIICCFY